MKVVGSMKTGKKYKFGGVIPSAEKQYQLYLARKCYSCNEELSSPVPHDQGEKVICKRCFNNG